jgi:hypothetical protein
VKKPKVGTVKFDSGINVAEKANWLIATYKMDTLAKWAQLGAQIKKLFSKKTYYIF